jgi:WD40 repeat protein
VNYNGDRCIRLTFFRKWDVDSRQYRCLLTLDKVYVFTFLSDSSLNSNYPPRPRGALSPDGRHFAIPNRKGTFDIYDLLSRDKLDWLNDPDLEEDQKNTGLRTRPGAFIHGGRYFLGASFGRVNIWNTAHNIRGQRLSLGTFFLFVVYIRS